MGVFDPTPVRVRREHKDTLFRDLFGSEDRKQYTLSLYNALNGTSYDDPELIEITTLGDVLYLSVRNDVSLIIDDRMVLWEHQSTYNPNMPLRGLSYFSRLYTAWARKNQVQIYSSAPVRIPMPQYVVFYVGKRGRPERETMRLSDLFERGLRSGEMEPALEVVTTVINVNEGNNSELMRACETLGGYAHFLALIRELRENGMSIEDAVDEAIERCIADGILADYLAERRAEVRDILLGEMTEAEYQELLEHDRLRYGREQFAAGEAEGEARGLAKGEARGRARELERAAKAVASGALTLDEAVGIFALSDSERSLVAEMVVKHSE